MNHTLTKDQQEEISRQIEQGYVIAPYLEMALNTINEMEREKGQDYLFESPVLYRVAAFWYEAHEELLGLKPTKKQVKDRLDGQIKAAKEGRELQ